MMKSHFFKHKIKGLSLVEALIYMAIFGVLFLTTLQFLFIVEENNRTAILQTQIDRSGVFIDEHLTYSFENTASIVPAGSTFDNDSGVLQLNIDSVVNTYSLSNGRLILNKNSTNYFLTSPDLNIERFRVTQILDSANNLSGVRVEVTIGSALDSDLEKTIENAYFI